ncbi:unnamed protein product, partial [Brenthis ino]
MDTIHSQIGLPMKQLADRYADYSGTAHDQPLYYPYEPSQPAQGHIVPTKHHYGGGSSHKNNAAMSALTLLAFLFFLHILQQCLKDHMTAMSTPQVMIMTGGRDGEESIAKQTHNKFDKTGEFETDTDNKRNTLGKTLSENGNDENYLKITTSEDARWRKSQKHQNTFKKNTDISGFINPPEDY